MTKSTKGKGRAPQDLPVTASIPLGKQLAHTDKKIRDNAVANLAAFLSSGSSSSTRTINLTSTSTDAISSPSTTKSSSSQAYEHGESYILLPPLEMRKLWKGLFYCFWMSDKPLVQQRLASDLGSLVLMIDPDADGMDGVGQNEKDKEERRLMGALEFVDGFWEALVREWSGIDRLRMDKYLMLIRRFQSSTFRLLARHGFPSSGLQKYSEMLTRSGAVLGWDDSKVLPSLSFHLADVWLEELDKMFAAEPETLPIFLPDILHPFILLLACTPNPTTYTRLESAIFSPLLASISPPVERPNKKRKISAVEVEEKEPAFGNLVAHASTKIGGKVAEKEALRSAVLARMMDVASGKFSTGTKEMVERIRAGVKDANRRKVYAFVREWGGVDDEDEEEED